MRYVGLNGFAQVGKDTAALQLINLGFTRYGFADRLREIAEILDFRVDGTISVSMLLKNVGGDWAAAEKHRVYGPELTRALTTVKKVIAIDTFGDRTRADEDIQDDVLTLDPFLDGTTTIRSLRFGQGLSWDEMKTHRIYGVEVRRILQKLGTEVVRDNYGTNAWVDFVERLIGAQQPDDVVLSDVRFDNEAEWVRANGGVVLKVTRPGVVAINGHVSDQGISAHLIDAVIVNDGTVEDLGRKVAEAINVTPVLRNAA